MPKKIDDYEAHFWSKVDKSGDCWEWLGYKTPNGYGQYHVNREPIGTHRYSLELVVGALPKGLFALHKCNNPSCVRPNHLYAGTKSENAIDSAKVGTHASSKFKPEQVRQIREMHRNGTNWRELVSAFDVPQQTIHNLISGRTYGWVE